MPNREVINRREYLLDKLKTKTINDNEPIELRDILQREQSQTTNLGNLAIVIGTNILLGLVADYLSKNKFDLGKLFGFRKYKKKLILSF